MFFKENAVLWAFFFLLAFAVGVYLAVIYFGQWIRFGCFAFASILCGIAATRYISIYLPQKRLKEIKRKRG